MIFNFFRNIFKKEKKKAKNDNYEPIVFVNSPISNIEEDVIGLEPIKKSITKAIKKEASMIGVIADYGTGKSSLIDLLSKNKKVYKTPININMWDCLQKIKDNSSDNSTKISNLIKSFLYQLASGHSKESSLKLAKYVNKRLSNNYGVISFSTISLKIWWFFGGAAIMYALYLAVSSASINMIVTISDTLGIEIQNFSHFLKFFSPGLLVIALLLILFGLKETSLAYSYWKNQSKRESEINDVFDLYNEVAYKLYKKCSRKTQLIIIEDLDRIEEKSIVLSFLRELYRFHNLLSKSLRKKLVLIVSVKPESMLKELNNEKYEDDHTFAKFFDYLVNLKPIHVEDYETIIIAIIKNSGEKEKLVELLAKNKDDFETKLPLSFEWLYQGQNLTIRDLKDRLSQAVNLYLTLNNKNYTDAAINFASCAAVTYLEFQYGKGYYSLLKKESDFASIVRESFITINRKNTKKEIITDLQNQLTNLGLTNRSFISDISNMIFNGQIDNDFRMYFYSYPKDSYIKTSDEKDVENCILSPTENFYDEDLDEKVNRILAKNKETKKPKQVICEALERVNEAISEKVRKNFPAIILENDYILATAWGINQIKTMDLICSEVQWNAEQIEKSSIAFKKIYTFMQFEKHSFLSQHSQRFMDQIINFQPNVLVTVRIALIEILGEDITYYKNAFLSNYPIITKEELDKIEDIETAIQLIDTAKIREEHINYIAGTVNRDLLGEDDYKKASLLYQSIIILGFVSRSSIARYLLDFLTVNNSIEDSFFEIIVNEVESVKIESIIKYYINFLPIESMTESYYQKLDGLFIKEGLSEPIIEQLEKRGLYHTYLCTMDNAERLAEIDYSKEKVQGYVLKACEAFKTIYQQIIISIRQTILKKEIRIVEKFKELFFDYYPIITKLELELFKDFEESIYYINKGKVTSENCKYIIEYINQHKRTSAECYMIFTIVLDPSVAISDLTVIKQIVDSFDYQKIDFAGMNIEQKEEVCAIISGAMGFSNGNNCITFMKTVNSLIPTLEQTVITAGLINDYVSLINEIDNPTDQTIKWLEETTIDFALKPNITTKLFEKEQYAKYIIGKTLEDEKLTFDTDTIDGAVYLSVFKANNKAFNIMSNNVMFKEYIVSNKLYTDMDKIRLKTLSVVPQTSELLIKVFDLLDESEIGEYISNIPLLDELESKGITRHIGQNGNHQKIGNHRKKLYKKLHRNYKGRLSRIMNSKDQEPPA